MTQVTKAMGEIPRALSQIYYCIDGHEKGEEGVRKKRREGGGGGRGGMGDGDGKEGRKSAVA